MRHLVKKKRFGRHSSHRIAMFRNMVTSLIEEGRITTTLAKAKALRGLAEKMVTLAKVGTLHARRQAARVVRRNEAVKKLFSVLGPSFQGRNGGYTRVLKLGYRRGDGAQMALVEYLGFDKHVEAKPEKAEASAKPKAKKAAKPKAKAEKAKEKEPKKEAKNEAKKKESKGKKAKD